MERAGRVVIGVVCLVLLFGAGAMAVDAAARGAWLSVLSAVVGGVVFLIGAAGGLLGPQRLPEKSVAQLIGWEWLAGVLSRPLGGVRGSGPERR